MWWVLALALLSCAVNVTQIVYNWRLMRRWQRLDAMLLLLCCQAYALRLAPIWQAWNGAMPRDAQFSIDPLTGDVIKRG